MAILDGVLEAMNPRTLADDTDALRIERAAIEPELARLTRAIAEGG